MVIIPERFRYLLHLITMMVVLTSYQMMGMYADHTRDVINIITGPDKMNTISTLKTYFQNHPNLEPATYLNQHRQDNADCSYSIYPLEAVILDLNRSTKESIELVTFLLENGASVCPDKSRPHYFIKRALSHLKWDILRLLTTVSRYNHEHRESPDESVKKQIDDALIKLHCMTPPPRVYSIHQMLGSTVSLSVLTAIITSGIWWLCTQHTSCKKDTDEQEVEN
jgi:hypothetical protein